VEVSEDLTNILPLLHRELPEIDAFGIIEAKDTISMDQVAILKSIDKLKVPYYYSKISVNKYLRMPEAKTGAYITCWQDLESTEQVTFDGLIDHWGRRKPLFNQIQKRWTGHFTAVDIPQIKILLPTQGTYPGSKLTYIALVNKNDQWTLASKTQNDLWFAWHLVKMDEYGNGIFMKYLGEGNEISFKIPDDPDTYKLYLVAIRGNDVITTQSILNTPLFPAVGTAKK
jgi:cellulose synthase (UDP-forming)